VVPYKSVDPYFHSVATVLAGVVHILPVKSTKCTSNKKLHTVDFASLLMFRRKRMVGAGSYFLVSSNHTHNTRL
jgi:hypothetical protein